MPIRDRGQTATRTARRARAGAQVAVRSASEILATLDAQGRLDGLPFMPEMAAHIGRTFTVRRRAELTCVEGHGLRRIEGTVFLEAPRCDGAAHDGCERRCLTFWKAAWLRPLAEPAALVDAAAERRALERLKALPTRAGDRYACQSTALAAATRPLSRWDLGYLARALAGRELTAVQVAAIAARMLVNALRRPLGLADLDVLAGDAPHASKGSLGLEAGDWVRVRKARDIRRTLGPDGKNRGLSFEPEMTRHAGQLRQVDYPVRRIILEQSGRMAGLTATVALKGVVCQGLCARGCPRANPLYWREAWLERSSEHRGAL